MQQFGNLFAKINIVVHIVVHCGTISIELSMDNTDNIKIQVLSIPMCRYSVSVFPGARRE